MKGANPMSLFASKRYTRRMSIPIDPETYEDIQAVAKPAGATLAVVVREAIKRGLPLIRESQRKARTRKRT